MGKSESKQFSEEVLRCHNEYRRKHQAPPLKLNRKLSREAARYAESLASTRILKHSVESSKGNYGENLAWASYNQSGKEVADRWYDEVKQYNFNRPGFSSGTGHFTAMVWKSTKEMGVGKAIASDGSSFVVARYLPAGNITNQGHFENNLPCEPVVIGPQSGEERRGEERRGEERRGEENDRRGRKRTDVEIIYRVRRSMNDNRSVGRASFQTLLHLPGSHYYGYYCSFEGMYPQSPSMDDNFLWKS
ncbi:hypothetical protein INR49_024110 [Caranx melampygus]|nr:hypothetical protein INR49_024110 [Caranx melampygus]